MSASTSSIPDQLRHNRNFILLWCAYGISALGDHLSEMAILQMKGAVDAGADATPVNARITFMLFLPFLVVGPFAGLLADRLPRRGIMIFADLVRCAAMFFLFSLLTSTEGWGDMLQFAPLLLVCCFAAFFSPARLALLPSIVQHDQIARANGLISGLGIIATMASTVIGGQLAKHYAPQVSFQIDAVSFLASAVFLLVMRVPGRADSASAGPLHSMSFAELKHGFRYAIRHRFIRELIAIAGLVWFCGAMVNTIVPSVVSDVYHGDIGSIGFFRALLGGGFILGGITIVVLGESLRQEIGITWGLFGISASIAVFALTIFVRVSPLISAPVGGASIVFAGFFASIVIASYTSLLQKTLPDRFRGRVFGVSDLCTTGALLLATGILGIPAWKNLDAWVGYILLAVALLIFMAGATTLTVRMKRSPFDAEYTFWFHGNQLLARFWWRMQRIGRSTVPTQGGVIVTANHRTVADPLLLCASVPNRKLSFMVAKEYTQWPVFSYFLRISEAIPVTRSGQDTGAMKQAMRALRDGKSIGIFIEGGIIPPGEKSEPRDGVAMLALRTGVKVVPAHISGVRYRDSVVMSLLSRKHARVRYGPPVDLSDLAQDPGNRDNVRAATQRIYSAIQSLAPLGDVYEGDEPKRKRRRRSNEIEPASEPGAPATGSP